MTNEVQNRMWDDLRHVLGKSILMVTSFKKSRCLSINVCVHLGLVVCNAIIDTMDGNCFHVMATIRDGCIHSFEFKRIKSDGVIQSSTDEAMLHNINQNVSA